MTDVEEGSSLRAAGDIFKETVVGACKKKLPSLSVSAQYPTDEVTETAEPVAPRQNSASPGMHNEGKMWKRLKSFLNVSPSLSSSFRLRSPDSVGFLQRLKMLQDQNQTDGDKRTVSRRSDAVAALMEKKRVVRQEDLTSAEMLEQRHIDRLNRSRYSDVPDNLKAFVSKAELDILLELFTSSDTDKSGLIGVAELPDMLRILGLNPVDFTVNALLKEFDTSADGELNFGEFVSLWYAYREERSKEDVTLEMAFAFFDRDGSNSISKGEFATVLQELGEPLSEDEINEFFRLVDVDQTDRISKAEFMKACGPEGVASALDNAAN